MFGILEIGEETGGMPHIRLIQCDGYSAYRAIASRYSTIKLAACLAHIRRKFYDSIKQSPDVVVPILMTIAELYRIERTLRHSGAPPDCRELVRRARSRSLVTELKKQILTERQKHFPKSKLGEAITYALGQW